MLRSRKFWVKNYFKKKNQLLIQLTCCLLAWGIVTMRISMRVFMLIFRSISSLVRMIKNNLLPFLKKQVTSSCQLISCVVALSFAFICGKTTRLLYQKENYVQYFMSTTRIHMIWLAQKNKLIQSHFSTKKYHK